MSSKTLTVYYLHSLTSNYDAVALSNWAESQPSEFTLLGKAEAEFKLGDESDVLAAKVAGLESLATQIRAEAQVRINRVNDRIQSLLSITHQPEAQPCTPQTK